MRSFGYKSINLKIGLLVILMIVNFILLKTGFFIQNVGAETCGDNECTGDWYNCDSNTYCCYGDGCPSELCDGKPAYCSYDATTHVCYNPTVCTGDCNSAPPVGCCGSACVCAGGVYSGCTKCSCSVDGKCSPCTGEDDDDDSCLLSETEVGLVNNQSKPIEDIQPGEYVTSFNSTGEVSEYRVGAVETPIRSGYYKITLEDGTELDLTNEHPVYFKNDVFQGWGSLDPGATYRQDSMKVERIHKGDYLYKSDRNWYEITDIEYFDGSVQTYNLKHIEHSNSFFANGVLVHNKDCTFPDSPVLVSPTNLNVCLETTNVNLQWLDISNWGSNCLNPVYNYEVYVDNVLVATYANDDTTNLWSHAYTSTWGAEHVWYVRATNGTLYSDSSVWYFATNGCTKIMGRVWEDRIAPFGDYTTGFNTTPQGVETWSKDAADACAFAVDLDIDIDWAGSNVSILPPTDVAWSCNWSGALYESGEFTMSGGPTVPAYVEVTITTPDPLLFPYASWEFFNFNGTSMVPAASGNDKTAEIFLKDEAGNLSNHLQWKLEGNTPPIARIEDDTLPTDEHKQIVTYGGINRTIWYYKANEVNILDLIAYDTRMVYEYFPTMITPVIERYTFSPSTWLIDAATKVTLYPGVSDKDYSDEGYDAYFNINNLIQPGYKIYVPVVQDEIAQISANNTNQCSGNPAVHAGSVTYADCDPDHTVDGFEDEFLTYGDNVPVIVDGIWDPGTIYASGGAGYDDSIQLYNFRGQDNDEQNVQKTWILPSDWSFPQIKRIDITAYGTVDPAEPLVYPYMELYVGNNSIDGSRTKIGGWTVTASASPYSAVLPDPNVDVSSIDIVFTNDYWLRDLYLSSVSIVMDFNGQEYTKTVYPRPLSTNVYMDTGGIGKRFDGVSIQYFLSGTVDVGKVPYTGSVSIPIPLAAGVSSGTVLLRAVPNSPLPYYDGDAGGDLWVNVINPTYTLQGHIYQKTDPICPDLTELATPLNNINPPAIAIKDEFNNVVSGYESIPTNSSNDFSISNIPLLYSKGYTEIKICLVPDAADTSLYQTACQKEYLEVGAEPPGGNNLWVSADNCSNLINTAVLSGDILNVNLGLNKFSDQKWSVVLEGDYYVPSIDIDLAETSVGGFYPSVLNRTNANLRGGYAFVGGGSDLINLSMDNLAVGETEENIGLAEQGGSYSNNSYYSGYAYDLSKHTGNDFTDKWLNEFSFIPPSGASNAQPAISGSIATFVYQAVYSYNLAEFNSWYLLPVDIYDLDGEGVGETRVTVVYVTETAPDSDDILRFDHKLGTKNARKQLIIITNLPVEISGTDDVATDKDLTIDDAWLVDDGVSDLNDCTNHQAGQQFSYICTAEGTLAEGYLDATIISSASIKLLSVYNNATDTYDLPIMLNGSLISKDVVRLNRDIGPMKNTYYPSEMLRYSRSVMPGLFRLFLATEDDPNYTGFGKFDIQVADE